MEIHFDFELNPGVPVHRHRTAVTLGQMVTTMKQKRFLYSLAWAAVLFTACTKNFELIPTSPSTPPTSPTPTPTSPAPTPTPTFTPSATPAIGTWTRTPTPTGTPTHTPCVTPGSPTATNTPGNPYPTKTPVPCLTYTALSSMVPDRSSYHPVVSVFKNKMWILPGFYNTNDTWSSSDGTNWTQMSTTTDLLNNFNYSTVEFKNQLWSIGGNLDFVNLPPAISSATSDGVHWSQVATLTNIGARENMSLVIFNNLIWAIAGDTAVTFSCGAGWRAETNDVWSSPDGANWTQATAQAPFGPRSRNGCVVYDNKMWVIAGSCIPVAGSPNMQYYNDVWCSTDGTNWTAATQNAPFTPRDRALVTVFNGELWVMGGYDPQNYPASSTEVWHSSDGVNWTQTANPCNVTFYEDLNWNFNNMIWGKDTVARTSAPFYVLRFFHL